MSILNLESLQQTVNYLIGSMVKSTEALAEQIERINKKNSELQQEVIEWRIKHKNSVCFTCRSGIEQVKLRNLANEIGITSSVHEASYVYDSVFGLSAVQNAKKISNQCRSIQHELNQMGTESFFNKESTSLIQAIDNILMQNVLIREQFENKDSTHDSILGCVQDFNQIAKKIDANYYSSERLDNENSARKSLNEVFSARKSLHGLSKDQLNLSKLKKLLEVPIRSFFLKYQKILQQRYITNQKANKVNESKSSSLSEKSRQGEKNGPSAQKMLNSTQDALFHTVSTQTTLLKQEDVYKNLEKSYQSMSKQVEYIRISKNKQTYNMLSTIDMAQKNQKQLIQLKSKNKELESLKVQWSQKLQALQQESRMKIDQTVAQKNYILDAATDQKSKLNQQVQTLKAEIRNLMKQNKELKAPIRKKQSAEVQTYLQGFAKPKQLESIETQTEFHHQVEKRSPRIKHNHSKGTLKSIRSIKLLDSRFSERNFQGEECQIQLVDPTKISSTIEITAEAQIAQEKIISKDIIEPQFIENIVLQQNQSNKDSKKKLACVVQRHKKEKSSLKAKYNQSTISLFDKSNDTNSKNSQKLIDFPANFNIDKSNLLKMINPSQTDAKSSLDYQPFLDVQYRGMSIRSSSLTKKSIEPHDGLTVMSTTPPTPISTPNPPILRQSPNKSSFKTERLRQKPTQHQNSPVPMFPSPLMPSFKGNQLTTANTTMGRGFNGSNFNSGSSKAKIYQELLQSQRSPLSITASKFPSNKKASKRQQKQSNNNSMRMSSGLNSFYQTAQCQTQIFAKYRNLSKQKAIKEIQFRQPQSVSSVLKLRQSLNNLQSNTVQFVVNSSPKTVITPVAFDSQNQREKTQILKLVSQKFDQLKQKGLISMLQQNIDTCKEAHSLSNMTKSGLISIEKSPSSLMKRYQFIGFEDFQMLFESHKTALKFEKNEGVYNRLQTEFIMLDNQHSGKCQEIQQYFQSLRKTDITKFEGYALFFYKPATFSMNFLQPQKPSGRTKCSYRSSLVNERLKLKKSLNSQSNDMFTAANQYFKKTFMKLYRFHETEHGKCSHIDRFLQQAGQCEWSKSRTLIRSNSKALSKVFSKNNINITKSCSNTSNLID